MNKWIIAGRVGKDGELKSTNSGTPVLSFSLAVDQRKGREKGTMWVDVSVFGKLAEAVAQYVTKGAVLSVAGEASAREYQGKVYMQCNASDLTLLGGGQKGSQPQGYRQARQPASAPPADMQDDDIPF